MNYDFARFALNRVCPLSSREWPFSTRLHFNVVHPLYAFQLNQPQTTQELYAGTKPVVLEPSLQIFNQSHHPSNHVFNVAMNNGCGICALVEDQDGADPDLRQPPCNHVFHVECIREMNLVGRSLACPICRRIMPSNHPDFNNWANLFGEDAS